jgi:hypothetical protein
MSMDLARNQRMTFAGQVAGGVLKVAIEGPLGNKVKSIPLPDDIITYLAEDALVQQRRPKPGDRLSYRLFDPTTVNVIRFDIEVKGYEQVPLDGVNRKLLRMVTKPEKIQGVQLPSQTLWYDDEYRLVLSEGDVPGLGELTLRRTSREKALAPNGKLRDLGDQSILLTGRIEDVHRRKKIVYRVNFAKDLEDAEKLFAVGDGRQAVREVTPKGLELVITAVRTPPAVADNQIVPKEYLESNYFINSDDEKVRELAERAAGEIADPWQKARAIERWVRSNMRGVAFTEAMATADHVARTLTGDCTEYAMLAAAMCRAQGIPSRTAIGMVNVEGTRKLAFHMWTEVFVRGQWLALDATLGYGSVGPGHVKITDHSWYDVRSMTPLLPVMRVMMAKPKMEVLKVE